MGQSSSALNRRSKPHRPARSTLATMPHVPAAAVNLDAVPVAGCDYINSLPDECLALIFTSLSSGDRKRCSLVCRRWLAVEGQSRHRLSLDARAALALAVPSLLNRFDSVSKLALKCDRRADSIDDATLTLISSRIPHLLRLKIRSCREITAAGMGSLAANCPRLRKLSCASCAFGPKGVLAIFRECRSLEELSIKRLRGLGDSDSDLNFIPTSLKSISLKDLYNAQCFAPLISASAPNLAVLRLSRCSGDWDKILEEIAPKASGLVEIHLEKLQVGDRGLAALASCTKLEILHLVKAPECTDLGLTSLSEGCRKLRKLHIDGWKTNRIGDSALAAIARWCPDLQELVLIGINPTAASLALIAVGCRNLERLALCGSETFGDAEIACLADKCFALKKLCIKGCPVTNQGMGALARGCPSLVKVKVKKCKNVTPDCADWLRITRSSLAVNLDIVGPVELHDESVVSDSGILDNSTDHMSAFVDQFAGIDFASSSNGRSVFSKARMGWLSGRNFLTSTVRKLSSSSHGGNGSGCSNPTRIGDE